MSAVAAALMGYLGGMLGGLLGVGGGVIFVPALTIFMDETQVRAEATSLLAIVPVAVVGAYRQHSYGNLRPRDGMVVGFLALPGVLIGVGLANVVPERALAIAFACVQLVFAFGLARRAITGGSES